jgi:hypothetical protein
MSNKILVTYATCTGSTAGVAEAIGKTLAEDGTPVDVLPMLEVRDLAPYRGVVAAARSKTSAGCRRPCSSSGRTRLNCHASPSPLFWCA